MANTGCTAQTRPMAERFLRIFSGFDYVVCPSGSCVAMVRCHYDEYLAGRPLFDELRQKTFELCEFLVDELGGNDLGSTQGGGEGGDAGQHGPTTAQVL